MLLAAVAPLYLAAVAGAQVTVYGQAPLWQTASAATPTASPNAYNDTVLAPPPVPSPPPTTNYNLPLLKASTSVANLSIPHVGGSFFGFSIEMSVISQVLGKNSSLLGVPMLNLISNLQERSGGVLIRLGGNTQEFAALVDHIDGGHTFAKVDSGSTQTTKTPAVLYTLDMFYMASNISSMLNVKWFLGIPFNDTNWRLEIAEYGQQILGDNLLGLQAGNEPDFYATSGRRNESYQPQDYFGEIATLIQTIEGNPKIPNKNMLIGPSVATGPWTPEQVWATGYIDAYKANMYCFSVEHYPNNNCAANFNTGQAIIDPETIFPDYLNHGGVQNLVNPYINSANLATAAGKPFIMFETNTASCGGFAGISDSYGASLWAIDYGFQLAFGNFTHALLHFGGQNAFYNPFTAPPTNQSTFNEWTLGAVYYSTLVLAEAFGKTNTSQVVDLQANAASPYTPGYAIYEQGTLSKVALINYISDATGASSLLVSVSVDTGGVPASVRVKYLTSDSVSTKANIAWAGQYFGGKFQVDGRFKGTLNVTTVNCDQTANVCRIPVPSPGFALVFMNSADPMIAESQAQKTFATTARTRTVNTVTVDPTVLATSNGHSADIRGSLGSTTHGSISSTSGMNSLLPGATVLLSAVLGAFVVTKGFAR